MILSPAFISAAPALAYRITKSTATEHDIADRACLKEEQPTSLSNHIIIIGYGINGRNLALAAKTHQIPYTIIETNPETVAKEKAKGEPIMFGDASFPHVLEKAGINQAKILCVLIADPFSTRKIVDTANRISPGLHIIVRSRQVEEVEKLLHLGADEVIPEEFETSLEIFSRVLRNYLVPEIKIEEMTEELRQQQYLKLANPTDEKIPSAGAIVPPDVTIETVLVGPEYGAAGSSLQDLDVRNKYGVTIIGIHRQGKVIEHPSAKEILLHGDYVFVLGKRTGVHRFAKFLLGA